MLQRLVVRGREAARRPVALIEDEPQEVRAVIQQKSIALRRDRTERRVRHGLIEQLLALTPQIELYVDQVRCVRTPEQLVPRIVYARIGERDPAIHLASDDGVAVGRELFPPARQRHGETAHVRRDAADSGEDADFPSHEVGRVLDHPQRGLRDAFHPDRLPDAGRPRIPHRVRFQLPVLFAARLGEIDRVIVDAHDNLELAGGGDERRDVERERRVATFVRAHSDAIHPDRGRIIHGAEMKNQPTIRRGVGPNGLAAIPARTDRSRCRRCHSRRIPGQTARRFGPSTPHRLVCARCQSDR